MEESALFARIAVSVRILICRLPGLGYDRRSCVRPGGRVQPRTAGPRRGTNFAMRYGIRHNGECFEVVVAGFSMTYDVRWDGDCYEVVTTGHPSHFHALPMAPTKIEDALLRGDWLVLCFAVWSGPDIEAIGLAMSELCQYGSVSVGIRPFLEYSETQAWCSEVNSDFGSPMWLFFRDGRLLRQKHCGLTASGLWRFLEG